MGSEHTLTAGLEIHQQLDTREKLFCRCPTLLRESGEHHGEFYRFLRATESELGEIDRAAKEEMMVTRRFRYLTYDTTCLVENDEEPPAPLNREALNLTLVIARLFGMAPVPQVHTMRKLVIDGSNTSGFQRTALVAIRGSLPNGGGIETICLEEEAAQRVEDETFSVDRLGIPLVEITTAPCMHTPEEVQEMAQYMGMVLRSTGKVKRGLGTIRQDINISIPDGARVEIKGVQELDLIAEVVRREMLRQQNLIGIREELVARGASVDTQVREVTHLFRGTKSPVLAKAALILCVRLCGFATLVGREVQPGRRLGSELADYARRCGVGGIFHTDELPAYGVTAGEVEELHTFIAEIDPAQPAADMDSNLSVPDNPPGHRDCLVLIAGSASKAACAAQQVIRRAQMALTGVPEETRKLLEGGSTAYMRPLPGAARMYPETDVLPVRIDEETYGSIPLPELLTLRAARFVKEYGLDEDLARQIAFSERLLLFEHLMAQGCQPNLACRTLVGTIRELARSGSDVDCIADADILALLQAVEGGRVAKEAVPAILREVSAGKPLTVAIDALVLPLTAEELSEVIRRILRERAVFVREKKSGAFAPLMGVVMKEVRGRVDGKLVGECLKRELGAFLSE